MIFAGRYRAVKAGIAFQSIPYKGAATTMTDMLTGQIDMAFEPTSLVLAHVEDAKVRPLAVTSAIRSRYLPALPTMIESGVPGVVAESWTGIVAPAGTPREVIDKVNRAINDALASDDMRLALSKLGGEGVGGSAQDFSALLAQEGPKWIAMVQSAGLKID